MEFLKALYDKGILLVFLSAWDEQRFRCKQDREGQVFHEGSGQQQSEAKEQSKARRTEFDPRKLSQDLKSPFLLYYGHQGYINKIF